MHTDLLSLLVGDWDDVAPRYVGVPTESIDVRGRRP
jgi:hypothetical protein